MPTMRSLTTLLLMLLLTACGQKGPLYLDTDDAGSPAPATEQANADDESDESDEGEDDGDGGAPDP